MRNRGRCQTQETLSKGLETQIVPVRRNLERETTTKWKKGYEGSVPAKPVLGASSIVETSIRNESR